MVTKDHDFSSTLTRLAQPGWASELNQFQAAMIRSLRAVGVADCLIWLALTNVAEHTPPGKRAPVTPE